MKAKRSIKTILTLFFVLSVIVISVIISALSIFSLRHSSTQAVRKYEDAMNEGYQTEIKSQVETAIAVLQAEYDKVQAGILTEKEAKEEAKEIIRIMRYRDDGSGYFWIDDTDYNLVMHPILTEQEGTNRYDLEDQNGVMIIQKIMSAVEGAEAGGFNEFYFTKSDGVTVAPKIAYSEIFTPWGWVVSTGNYVDEMQQETQQTKTEMEQMFSGLIKEVLLVDIIVLAVMIFVGRSFGNWLCNPIIRLSGVAKEVSVGKIDTELARSDGATEIAALQNSFCDMIDNFKYQADTINQVAGGNLCLDVAAKSEEDMVGNALVKMIADNNQMFLKVKNIAGQIHSGSEQIAAASQNLAQGAAQQAGAIEKISASVSDISDKSQVNADYVDEVDQIISDTGKNAAAGNEKMEELVVAMQEITDASANISKVIKVVRDIAFNTNILALNAAVEASRAGEQGKGFAVVAEEVRSLAAHSAESSGQIEDLISDSIQKVEKGFVLAQDTQKALKLISDSIDRIMELSKDVSVLSKEQAATAAQINNALNEVTAVTSTNSAASEEFAASSQELSNLAGELKRQLSRFRLKNTGSRLEENFGGYED
ncbi:MAG: cache domain-containing protein [Lachnospiraceae bacterium]|nr:cache domain-containing protein [Lachnospiraceae bacterium]